MKIKQFTIVALSTGIFLLAGCSTGKKPLGVSPEEGVSTAGYGSETGFGGGLRMSATACRQAPSNQQYYFDLNQYDIHQYDYPCINTQAKYLIAHPSEKIRLEGNCDNRGSREYNRALGWKRANAVRAALLQQGVSPGQITTFSWGSEKASVGVGESIWAKDRRVDLIYKKY